MYGDFPKDHNLIATGRPPMCHRLINRTFKHNILNNNMK